MTNSIDVVVVADFTGPKAQVFEIRTIFFLATWLEYAGSAQQFPLHLACIGTPPPAVARMAERAKAYITLHEPHPLAQLRPSFNKQRGFEVARQTDHLLLLDADVWVLSDFSELATLGYTLAAAPSGKTRVPSHYWHRIYAAFQMDSPPERIATIRGEYGWPLGQTPFYDGQEAELTNMFPYYNAGILYAPWSCSLSERWAENAQRIAALFPNGDPQTGADAAVMVSDQASFALTVEQLKRESVPFVRLSPPFHTNRIHLYAGGIKLSEVKLYHATEFAQERSYPISNYGKLLLKRMMHEWLYRHPNHPRLAYLWDFAISHSTVTYPLLCRIHQAYKKQFVNQNR